MLGPEVLGRLLFPLGEATKAEVRDQARRLGLAGAHKGESQELCFVPTGRYDAFVEARAGSKLRPGPVVDDMGRELGRHEGVHRFTLGQRRQLGVAIGRRAYVIGIDPDSGTVRLGDKQALLCREALVGEVALAPGLTLPFDCDVEVRYRGEPVPATLEARTSGHIAVRFARAVAPVVPGQYAVFYQGDRVLGGGVVLATAPVLAEAG
jgi:tRNA-specific 2-thiouridylase